MRNRNPNKTNLTNTKQTSKHKKIKKQTQWDTAAADIIVQEAGGAVVQAGRCSPTGELLEDWRDAVLREEPLQYNKEDLLNPCFVVFGRRQ